MASETTSWTTSKVVESLLTIRPGASWVSTMAPTLWRSFVTIIPKARRIWFLERTMERSSPPLLIAEYLRIVGGILEAQSDVELPLTDLDADRPGLEKLTDRIVVVDDFGQILFPFCV